MQKILFFIWIFICLSGFSDAQNCASLTGGTVAVEGNLGYQSRGSGHYCEGLVTLTHSAGVDIDIVSFTKGPLNFYASPSEVLTINNLLPNNIPQTVHGVNFNMYRHYRLDINFNGQDTVMIPAATVIAKIPILKENLGLYGYRKNGSNIIYNPVRVSAAKSRTLPDTAYRISLLKNVPFKAMEYRFANYQNSQIGPLSAPVMVNDSQVSGDKVTLILPPNIKKGQYLMVVYYLLNSGYKNSANFYITLP
jgi:hypothetical protein